MFEFLLMADNYDNRKIGRYDGKDFFISTAEVNDAIDPIETAIKHPEYNDGDLVIVETYNNRQDAQEGHDKWIKVMTSYVLPDELIDNGNSEISQLIDTIQGKEWRTYKRNARI